MNMMEMAAMEEAIDQALERPEVRQKYGWASKSMKGCFDEGFADGFRAGAAWARRQSQTEPSSQAVGKTSQYQGEAEAPEEEA